MEFAINQQNSMDENRNIAQCRLCGSLGPHALDIFGDTSNDLRGKIFRCVSVWVSDSSNVSL